MEKSTLDFRAAILRAARQQGWTGSDDLLLSDTLRTIAELIENIYYHVDTLPVYRALTWYIINGEASTDDMREASEAYGREAHNCRLLSEYGQHLAVLRRAIDYCLPGNVKGHDR